MNQTEFWNLLFDLGVLSNLIYSNFILNPQKQHPIPFNQIILEPSFQIPCIINQLKLFQTHNPKGMAVKYFCNSADVQAAITKHDTKKQFCLVFRGTESITDCKFNLLYKKCHLENNIYIRKGIYIQIYQDDLLNQIKTAISSYIQNYPNWTWNISGHSIGGSLAIYSGYIFAKQWPNIKWTIATFGTPRVGNKSFKNEFNQLKNIIVYRISHGRDPVPVLPKLGYCHVGQKIHCKLPFCLSSKKQRKWIIYPPEKHTKHIYFRCWNLTDHLILNYIDALQSQIS